MARPTGADCIRDSRGVAIADFNLDGKLDLVINNNNAAPTLYLNDLRQTGNWAAFRLVGRESNRDAIGAKVKLTVGGKTLLRQVEAGSGFASEMMLPVHFGLGAASRIERVEVLWPSGLVQTIEGAELGVNRFTRIEEGTMITARVKR